MKAAKKIKILYISHFGELKMGGQKSMLALISNLDREKFIPYAVVPYFGELSVKLNEVDCQCFAIPLKALKPKYLFDQLANLIKLVRIINSEQIAIVHPDHERDAILAGIACKFTKARMVWHVRLTRKVATDKMTFALSDKVIGIAEDVKNRFDNITSKPDKYQTIYNGVDCNVITPKDKATAKSELGLENTLPVITYAGQFKRGKGILDLIQAASLITHDFKLLLIGKSERDDFYDEMEMLIDALKLREKIMIVPFQVNIHDWFAASDIVVLPSHEGTEGMGRVLFEAMACGTAVIGTDISGVRQAIAPDTGLLVREKSPPELANAIKEFLSDKQFRNTHAQNGRLRAIEHFNIKNHTKKIETIYETILNNNV